MLEAQNLTKEYKDLIAVKNLSFKVNEGDIFGILGPNGAGKTSTIRMLLNIIKPTSGSVLFNSKVINENIFNKVGYLPEDRGLYQRSRSIDVIKYFGSLKGMTKSATLTASKYWFEKLKIKQLAEKKIEELSKGNQQKIQFITAVIHNPKILILDEPFSGFDPINQELITRIIADFKNSGRLIIISTHLMNIAENLCTDILLLNKGEKILKGKIETIKKDFGKNTFRIDFIGEINFIRSIPEVLEVKIFQNFAEVSLSQETSASEFLKKIIDRAEITGFTHLQPTLNNIFLEALAQTNAERT